MFTFSVPHCTAKLTHLQTQSPIVRATPACGSSPPTFASIDGYRSSSAGTPPFVDRPLTIHQLSHLTRPTHTTLSFINPQPSARHHCTKSSCSRSHYLLFSHGVLISSRFAACHRAPPSSPLVATNTVTSSPSLPLPVWTGAS